MPKVEEILSSIESLPKEEFGRLRDWFYERDWERWDRQIEEDSESGKLKSKCIKQLPDFGNVSKGFPRL
jgi:hypothetical protein